MNPQRHSLRWIRISMLLAQAIILAYAFTVNSELVTAFQTAAGLSGRLSLILFATIFLVHSADRRRSVVITLFAVFAVAQGIHLAELITYQVMEGSAIDLITGRVGEGFAAYLFIFLMPFMHKLERQQKAEVKKVIYLEYVYLCFIWIVFLFTYLPRVFGTPDVGGAYDEFVIGSSLTVGIMILKIALGVGRTLAQT